MSEMISDPFPETARVEADRTPINWGRVAKVASYTLLAVGSFKVARTGAEHFPVPQFIARPGEPAENVVIQDIKNDFSVGPDGRYVITVDPAEEPFVPRVAEVLDIPEEEVAARTPEKLWTDLSIEESVNDSQAKEDARDNRRSQFAWGVMAIVMTVSKSAELLGRGVSRRSKHEKAEGAKRAEETKEYWRKELAKKTLDQQLTDASEAMDDPDEPIDYDASPETLADLLGMPTEQDVAAQTDQIRAGIFEEKPPRNPKITDIFFGPLTDGLSGDRVAALEHQGKHTYTVRFLSLVAEIPHELSELLKRNRKNGSHSNGNGSEPDNSYLPETDVEEPARRTNGHNGHRSAEEIAEQISSWKGRVH